MEVSKGKLDTIFGEVDQDKPTKKVSSVKSTELTSTSKKRSLKVGPLKSKKNSLEKTQETSATNLNEINEPIKADYSKARNVKFSRDIQGRLVINLIVDGEIVIPIASNESSEQDTLNNEGVKNDVEGVVRPKNKNVKNPKKSITVKLKKDNKTKEEKGERLNKASKKNIKTSSNKSKNKSSRSTSSSKKRPSVEVRTLNQATKRAKKAPKPAKGVWGIIKSMLPRFNRE